MTGKQKNTALLIGGHRILKGERRRIYIDIGALYDYTPLSIPVEVIRGLEDGPSMFISAAVHGDEINGVETLKRLLKKPVLKKIKGTLIVVPVVNVFGFNNKSRYLPDRRDLNRSFPGGNQGSVAARMAHIFMKEVVSKCTHGIDLHTGAIHRTNYPQVRACLDDPETRALAKAFGVPVVIDSALKDGSLREAARKKGLITLLFEGGEALRFEEDIVRAGLNGCIRVMRAIGMIPLPSSPKNIIHKKPTFIARESFWIRASHSGSFRAHIKLGEHVNKGDVLASISDPFGEHRFDVCAEDNGIVIGMSTIPLVNRGEAMFHLATFKDSTRVKRAIDLLDGYV